jgi:hypothetical protein
MANDRLYPRLKENPEGLLLLALLGFWMTAGVARADEQIRGDTVTDQVRSAAQAASSTATSSGPASPVPGAAKKQPAEQKASKRAPGGLLIPTPMRAPRIVGLRDPFKLPPPPGPGGAVMAGGVSEGPLGPLPGGKRGLVVGQLRLEGIVRLDLSNTMIALVVNYSNRAWFLRENDAVYNGVVSKITPDSISFKENYLDQFGRAQVREIVKRLSGAAGEGR